MLKNAQDSCGQHAYDGQRQSQPQETQGRPKNIGEIHNQDILIKTSYK